MIVTGEKVYLKSYDSKLHNDTTKQNEINNLVQIENQQIQDNKVSRKERKNSNNYIYKNIRNKAQVLKKDQRDIQEKISTIQIQEQKVNEMEKLLNKVKKSYLQYIENGKQEEIKEKIKIKTIQKEINNLDKEYFIKETFLQDKDQVLSTVRQTLNKINDIKGKLAQYKSKLIELESQINRKKHDVECREKLMESYVEVEESINENIIINPLDFISIEGDINTGILVNILI